MYNHWNDDLYDSIKALEGIKETYLPKIISGNIHTIEGKDDHILIKIDIKSGIDYIRENEFGLQGIAARVQWGNSWNTFTIRKERHSGAKTEYQKRIEQIQNGYFYPFFTMQAYFDNRINNELLSMAIIKTIDLYDFIENNPELIKINYSDNKFMIVEWDDVENLIRRYPKIEKINSVSRKIETEQLDLFI